MRDVLRPFVDSHAVAVLDGGLASELEARGFPLNDRLWSARALLDAPEQIAAIHRDYLAAGADVITTATYQATIPGFVARGLSETEARRFLLFGVRLAATARDAVRSGAIVAASIGGYGAYLADGSEYSGAYGLSVEALMNWHRARLRLLERSKADILAFETIPSLSETDAIARLLAERDGPPAWISFQARDAARLADGAPLVQAAAIAERSPRVAAVGINCVPPERIEPLLRLLATATSKPLIAYPNRGDAWDATHRRWVVRGSPVDFASLVPVWRECGARVIGGCCRTTPADIRTIVTALGS